MAHRNRPTPAEPRALAALALPVLPVLIAALSMLGGCKPESAAKNQPGHSDRSGQPPTAEGEGFSGGNLPAVRGTAPEDAIVFDSLPPEEKPRLPPGLNDFQQIFADVAEKAIPAVVSIYSERNVSQPEGGSRYDDLLDNGPFQYFFGHPDAKRPNPHLRKETGLGSGVIISPSGYILTNNHVIEGADLIKVQLYDESEYVGTIVGTDKPSDMAVIKIKAKETRLPTLPLGSSGRLRIGEWVIAVGNPYGLSHTVTTGIISAKGRKNTGINSYENFLQTDAAINPGNSGGALMNLSGELIGINTAIFSRSGGYQGIGFAIPIDMAKKITQDLIRDGEVTRGWLGVSIQPIEPDQLETLKLKDKKGALVGGVVAGSPAEKSGIKRGDVITKVGGEEIKDANDLLNRIALLIPNEFVEIWVLRDGLTLNFRTRIAKRDEKRLATSAGGEQSEEASSAAAGLVVAALSKELRERFDLDQDLKHGVVVVSVDPDGRAAASKVLKGDVILEVNRIAIHDPEGFRAALGQGSKGNKILALVNRRGNTFFLTW
jgi:serine protease Do